MLTDERTEAIFKEMDEYVLELANDPSSMGPQYFQNIIATCRNYLNRVSLVVSEVNKERLYVSGELRKLEATYALEYDDLIANDERVRTLANIEDRKATAGFLLRDKKRQINELKDLMHILDAVNKLVTFRNKELHSTMTAIKDQRRLLQTEVATGAFYGDERIPRSPNGFGIDDDVTADELAALLNDDDSSEEAQGDAQEATEAPKVETKEELEPPPAKTPPANKNGAPTDDDVEAFLASSGESETESPQPVVGVQSPEPDDEMAEVLSMLDGL